MDKLSMLATVLISSWAVNDFSSLDFKHVHNSVKRDISPDDEMYMSVKHNLPIYLHAGLTALISSHQALVSVSHCQDKFMCMPAPSRLLVLPCAMGREVRYFAAAYPQATIVAGDVNANMADWTAKQFGAHSFHSHADPNVVLSNLTKTGGEFDLIWVGSLFTHFPQRLALKWLRVLIAVISKKGVLVFTTAGERCKTHFESTQEWSVLTRKYNENHGMYSFVPYNVPPPSVTKDSRSWIKADWGMSMVSFTHMNQLISKLPADLKYFQAGGYADFQDIYGIVSR